MRVLHLLKHCVEGNGHVHVAVDLACQQSREGHQVTFASGGGSYQDLLRAYGVRVVDIDSRTGALGFIRSLTSIVRLIVAFQPAVVHAHMMSSVVLARLALVGRRTPLVATMHNSFDVHSDLMILGTVVVAVSEAERTLLLSRGYPAPVIRTILNGSGRSPRDNSTSSPHLEMSRPCVITLSGLHARKAIPDAILAFAPLTPAFRGWHLNIVGDGPDRDAIECDITRLGLQQHVHLLGSTPSPRHLLEQADIFVSVSKAEPFGLAVAEARAAGCAVVATAVGGVPEVVDFGRSGQLVQPGDHKSLTRTLKELMSDPELLSQWQSRARDGSEYFEVSRMSADYVALYRGLVVEFSSFRPSRTVLDRGRLLLGSVVRLAWFRLRRRRRRHLGQQQPATSVRGRKS